MRRTLAACWYVLTLRCEEADRVACLERHGALSRRERIGAALHRMLCRSCRQAREQVQRLDHMFDELRAAERDACSGAARDGVATFSEKSE